MGFEGRALVLAVVLTQKNIEAMLAMDAMGTQPNMLIRLGRKSKKLPSALDKA